MEENQSKKETDVGFGLLRHQYKWGLKITCKLQHILTPSILKGSQQKNNVNTNQSFKGKNKKAARENPVPVKNV